MNVTTCHTKFSFIQQLFFNLCYFKHYSFGETYVFYNITTNQWTKGFHSVKALEIITKSTKSCKRVFQTYNFKLFRFFLLPNILYTCIFFYKNWTNIHTFAGHFTTNRLTLNSIKLNTFLKWFLIEQNGKYDEQEQEVVKINHEISEVKQRESSRFKVSFYIIGCTVYLFDKQCECCWIAVFLSS